MSTNAERKSGWPKDRGIFRCLVDDKPMILTHHYCELNNRHWWSTTDGHDVVGCKIEWIEKIQIV